MIPFETIELSHGCLGAAILLALLAIVVGLRPLMLTGVYDPAEEPLPKPSEEGRELPKASVIVYAYSRLEALDEYLPQLLAQDYPNYEVIVVLDTNAEAAARLSERYSLTFPSVNFTFIPPGSLNLSRRKLAVTLGLKAAKGEVAVLTSSNSVIASGQWLSRMMAPFVNDGKDVALGYSYVSPAQYGNGSKWYKQFDTFMTSCQWIGAAIGGNPYRGDRNNLAFRRDAFFEHKGFAKSIYLHAGDDDLFVHEIANGTNTGLVLNPEARVEMLWGVAAGRMYVDRKEQYWFTSRYLPRWPFLRAGWLSLCQWLVPGLCVASVLFSSTGWVLMLVAASILMCIFWTLEILVYRRAARRLGTVRLCFALPLFLLWHPIGNALFKLHHYKHWKQNFTWHRRGNFFLHLFSKY